MGLLGDFVGAFATNVGNEMYDNERQQQAIALQEALEARRIQRQQEAETRRRRQQNEDESVRLNMQGPQIGVDDAGNQGLLRIRSSVDPESGALRAERERVGDAPVTPVGRPMTIYDGPNRRSVQRYSDGSEKDLGAPSPVQASGGGGSGGSGAKDRFELRNIGGRVMRVNITTGEKEDMGPASSSNPSGGAKKESADTIREKWTAAATAVDAAEGDALRSIAAQYGMGGLPVTDDDVLRSEVLARVNDEFGSRLKGTKGADKESESGDSESNPVTTATKADVEKLPKGTWFVTPAGKVYQK